MKRISVQAYEDRTESDGGHAVLLLEGVMSVPERITIRIRSADASLTDGDGSPWEDGDVRARDRRVTENGIELLIGPEVAEDPFLPPGAVMEIEIPEAGLKGEFLWPQITPRARPKRKNIAPIRPRRDIRPGDEAYKAEANGHSLSESPSPVVVAETAHNADGSDANESRVPTAAGQAQPELTQRPASTLIDAHLKALRNATSVPSLPLTNPLNLAGRPLVSFDRKPPAQSSGPAHPHAKANGHSETSPSPLDDHGTKEKGAPAAELAPPLIDPHGAHVNLSTSLVVETNPNDPREPDADENPWAWRKDVTALLSTKFLAMSRPITNGQGDVKAADIVQAIEPQRAIEPWQAPRDSTGLVAVKAFMLKALPESWPAYAMAVGAIGALGLVTMQISQPPLDKVQVAVTSSVAATAKPSLSAAAPPGTFSAPSPSVTTALAPAAAPGSLFDALSAGTTSPRGASVTDVSASKALETANAILTATGSARDAEEGAFWLKRYITGVVGEERNMRVLTQLGSLYAEPAGEPPDFEKARTLWEISSAAGDPIAMCFLGQLHENGLGVDLDKKTALQWYEQSKRAGGCPAVDEAIARVEH